MHGAISSPGPVQPPRATRDLRSLFHARSVCLVGASGDPTRTAGQPLQILTRHGFEGEIVAVNPKYDRIGDVPCYPDLDHLPSPVDVALITLPASAVPGALEACGRRGIPNAVVLSAGFEETPEGRPLATAVREIAERYALNVVGPNSEGVWSVPGKVYLTHGTAAQRATIVPGPVSVLSQSGSIGAATARALQDRGIGCRYVVSVGNETMLSVLHYLRYVVDDGGTRVLLLFLEGLREATSFVELCRAAAGTQIVALKSGNSPSGREATASHTGKVATPARVYSSIFRQAGVLEVADMLELVQAAEVLATAPTPRAGGDRSGGVALVSASGGCRPLLADALERRGLPMARFATDTEQALEKLFDGQGHCQDPIDIPVSTLYDADRFARMLRTVAADPAVDALVVQYANRGALQLGEHADLLGRVVQETGKPLVASLLIADPDEEARHALAQRGVPVAREPGEAVKLVAWLYQRHAARTAAAPRTLPSLHHPEPLSAATVHWEEQVALLARAGILTPPWLRLGPDASAESVTASLRFPLAVKALPEQVDHKTEAGLVALGVATPAALAETVRRLRAALPAGADLLVQEMVTGAVEVLLAARRDPDFGPVLALGAGGTRVELLADVAYLQLPVSEDEVRDALRRLRVWSLLAGFRGQPPADVDALVGAAVRLGALFPDSADRLRELELNPLFVLPAGQGVMAVDVLSR